MINTHTANEVQIGASTHHHDQSIKPVSLSVMKTMVRRPAKPIPPLDELLFDVLMLLTTVRQP